MRKIFILLLVFIQFCGIVKTYSQWDGSTRETTWYYGHEEDATYIITTANQLAGLSWIVKEGNYDFDGKTIYIGTDPDSPVTIDLGGNIWSPIGYYVSSTSPDNRPFRGSVDGRNCTIKNFKIGTTSQYSGLFGYVRSNKDADGDDIVISRINVEANHLSGKGYIGGICGYISGYQSSPYHTNARIENCTFNGSITATSSYVGGIAGYALYAVIEECATAGQLTAYSYVGGIAGYAKGASTASKRTIVQNCVNSAKVQASKTNAGGIAGTTYRTNLRYNVNGGYVSSPDALSTGGIVGKDDGTTSLSYCLNVGYANNGGAISGNDCTMTYCFYDNQIAQSGQTGVFNGTDDAGSVWGESTSGLYAWGLSGNGDDWDDSHWSFDYDYYPVPKPLESSDFAKVASAYIKLDGFEILDELESDFELSRGAEWSVENASVKPDFITVTPGVYTAAVDGDGIAELKATVGNVSKIIFIDKYSGGSLTIDNVEDLQSFRDAVNGLTSSYKGIISYTGFQYYDFEITDNIDLSEIDNWVPIGTSANPFCGNVDGGNHVISGLNVMGSESYMGLFGYVQSGNISNLIVEGNVSSTTTNVGGICGCIAGSSSENLSTIENCHFIGAVRSTYSSTTGKSNVGGVCGYAAQFVKILGCSASGSVECKKAGYVGGIVGQFYGGNSSLWTGLKSCINLAEVTANVPVGGIAGYTYQFSNIFYNLNAGNITGNNAAAGGILGKGSTKSEVSVSKNINAATVNGNGSSIIGEFSAGTAEYNYYDNQRSLGLGMNAADDVAGQTEGKATSSITGTSLDLASLSLTESTPENGWVTTDGYPVPKYFSTDGAAGVIRNVAKSSATIATGQKYDNVTDDITLLATNGVTWESDNTGIIGNDGRNVGASAIPPEYGSVVLTASKVADVDGQEVNISKIVNVSVSSDESPLPIASYEDLKAFRDAVNLGSEGSYLGHRNVNGFANVSFKVTADIDMTDEENAWVAIGNTSTTPFNGNFDGGSNEGRKITNMTINTTSSNSTGLFGYVSPTIAPSTIENIDLSGTITAKTVGAIVGYTNGNSTNNAIIRNCHFNGTITASGNNVGGICGKSNAYTQILDCTTAGDKIKGSTCVGGICGLALANTVISGCASMSKSVEGTSSVGGIVGSAKSTTVSYCVNAAIVNGASSAGGIVGNAIVSTVLDECLNFITANSIGKIYGTDDGSLTMTSCYYDSRHCVLGTDNGVGKTTAEMKALTSELTGAMWTTYTGSYPIPINIASLSSAKVACAPLSLSGDEDNQHVHNNFTVCTENGIAWSLASIPDVDFITYSAPTVTVGSPEFSLIVMTASLNGWEKCVNLTNKDHNPEILITSKADLDDFRSAVNNGTAYHDVANVNGFEGKTFKLTGNINAGKCNTSIGTSARRFKGTFDGGNHTITMYATSGALRGLFGYVEDATIKKTNVITGSNSIVATNTCGGIVAYAISSTLDSCTFNGNITSTANYIGGIVGRMESTNVSRCAVAGVITSSSSVYVGGICGYAVSSSTIENCVNDMDVNGFSSIGGIAGYVLGSTVQNCINAGKIAGTAEEVNSNGGIVGYEDDGSSVASNLNAGTLYGEGGAVVGIKHDGASVSGNYFDNQRNVVEGIAEDGIGGVSSDAGAEGMTTEYLSQGDRGLLAGWTESEGLYPVPTPIHEMDATKLASVPVFLPSQYISVNSAFNLGSIDGLTWDYSIDVADANENGTPYLSLSGLHVSVDDEANTAIFTATYNGWKKTVMISNPVNEDPLMITSVAQLIQFRNAVNSGRTGAYKGVPNVNGFAGKRFQLDAPLSTFDLSDEDNWEPIGSSTTCPFSGEFDGNGNKVVNLNVDDASNSYKGLFGYVLGGSIKDLQVEGHVSGKSYVGGICGSIKGASGDSYSAITNCTFNGSVSAAASYAGGIAGSNNYYTVIDRCRVAGSVSAITSYSGGITGYSVSVSGKLDTISNCTNAAVVSSLDYLGGIAGKNTYSVIQYCNNGGDVIGMSYLTGGITGNNGNSKSYVNYCISTGLVFPSRDESDESDGGAIIGYNQGSASYNFYDKQRTPVNGCSSNTTGISSDVTNKYVGQLTSAITGSSPSGLTGDRWSSMYWRFTEGLYPIPAALEEDDDFAVVTATPVFLADAENWKNVHSDFTLGTPASVSWESSNSAFIDVETSYPTAEVDNSVDEMNAAVLTATINLIHKKFTLKDYGFISDLNIETITDLKNFRDAVNNRGVGAYKGVLNLDGYKGVTFHFIPDATVDLAGEGWTPIGNNPENCFVGNFEGNDNTIDNLTITDYEDAYAGLFGYVQGGIINHLNLTNVAITTAGGKAGTVCGFIIGTANETASIEYCNATGSIESSADSVGGIVGYVGKYVTVSNCTSAVNVNAQADAGGIAGYVNSDKLILDIIVNCENNGSVNTTGSYGGGIVGYYLNGGNIVGCTNNGDITSGASYAGGVVGLIKGNYTSSVVYPSIISECINEGSVNATTSYAGGIAGKSDTYTSISNSINRGDVTAGVYYAGGIAGYLLGASAAKTTVTECRNDGLVGGATTSYAGGIVGMLGAYSEVGTSVNSGDVKSVTYVGGIVGYSKTTSGTNRIAYCTNSANVEQTTTGSSKYVAGICPYNYRTEINYCNNGGNVKGKTASHIGGIAGYVGTSSEPNSSLLCNINTGTITPSSANNGIFGTNYGTVTTSFYDKQRTNSTSADGEYTSNLIGASPTAFDGVEGWTDENFVFGANMYPMPKGTEAYPEAKLAATPVIFNGTEVYDSVLNDFTVVTENSVSWTSDDDEYVAISSSDASVLKFKCTEKYNDTLRASITDGLTLLEKVVILRLSKVKVSHDAAYGTAYCLWTGAESGINWTGSGNWIAYDGERYWDATAPTSGNIVFIHQDDANCEFYSPVLTADKSVSNIVVAEGFGLGMESHTITVSGTATIGGSVIGNVTFEDGATCDDSDGYIDGVITKRGAGTFKFLTGHFDDSDGRNILLQSAFEMTVAGDDAEVAVHYTTDHETYPMPDSYSHGGNMGGELDHVSDRDFWHVTTNKTLTDVELYWKGRDPGINLAGNGEDSDCTLDFMRFAYVVAGGSAWNEISGTTDGNCLSGSIHIDELVAGGSRAGETVFDITLGSTDGNGKDLVLPINLVSFTASCDGNSVKIDWTTASERNNDYFILEKSYDAINFSEIARIAGAGNSIETLNYSFVDYENYGSEMFYRLQQVDYDGRYSTSEIIDVKCVDHEYEPAVTIFPNPFRSEITLSLVNFGNKPVTVEVFDIIGTLVRTMTIDGTGNAYETVLDFSELSAATYTIRISTVDYVVNKRIVKQ